MARRGGRRLAAAVLAGLVLAAGAPHAARAGTWVEVPGPSPGPFPLGGYTGYTQTLLRDGRVLVAGGVGGRGVSGACWIFDPAAGTWTQTGTMNDARAFHSATLLDDGKVLVAGGESTTTGTPLDSLELFDPAVGNGTWTKLSAHLISARWGHTATLLTTGSEAGSVLFVGGQNGSAVIQQVERYVPGSPTGSVVSDFHLKTARYDHTATRLASGRVVVVGGLDGTGTGANTVALVEVYTPGKGWSSTDTLPDGGRHGQAAVALGEDWMAIFGGFTDAANLKPATQVDVWDGTNAWKNAGAISSMTGGVAAVFRPDGHEILVESGSPTAPSTTIRSYLSGGKLSSAVKWDTMTHAYAHPVMTLLESGRILVTGTVPGGSTGFAEVSDPGSAAPAQPAGPDQSPCPIFAGHAPLEDGSVVSLGGQLQNGSADEDTIERYAPGVGFSVAHWSKTTPTSPPPRPDDGRRGAAARRQGAPRRRRRLQGQPRAHHAHLRSQRQQHGVRAVDGGRPKPGCGGRPP